MAGAVEAVSASLDGLRIVVCDSRKRDRESLGGFLRRQPGVSEVLLVANGDDAVRMMREDADILVLDSRYAGESGAVEVLEALDHLGNTSPVLLLGVPRDVTDIVRAVTTGPVGVVPTDVSPAKLLETIRRVVHGDVVLSEDVVAPVISQSRSRRREQERNSRVLDSLTGREKTVLHLLSLGLRRAEIAEELGLSPNTVRTHLAHVMQKVGAHTQLAAAMTGRQLLGLEGRDVITLPDTPQPRRPFDEPSAGRPRPVRQ